MKLRDDYALGAIDNERTIGRHQGNFTHVDLLLLDFLHGIRRFAIHDHQTNLRTQ